MKNNVIAIDGPAGAGKSTISKIVAKQLGYIYIDTGAMYRAVGLKALSCGLNTKLNIAEIINIMNNIDISIKFSELGQLVFLDGVDVTNLLRTPEVSIAASDVSAVPAVRIKLVELQRKLAHDNSVIMDGRDIGTNVLPNADLKIYLTASVEERAKRRYEELIEKGDKADFDKVKEDIIYRDTNDSTREFAPLKAADDAIILDTSGNSLEQSIDLLLNTIKEHTL